MRRCAIFLIIAVVAALALSCAKQEQHVDALLRSKVDALNKAAFQNRYRDAMRSERYARKALEYIADSLPQYQDGKLRAWNNLATSYSRRAMHDSAMIYIDSVVSYTGKCSNREVEQVLAHLLEARIRQRNCDIAGSYRILYDIENSGFLDNDGGGLLYNLAVSQFYITTTTLNYHYRNKSQYEQAELLTEMEHRRPQLRCDYAEDMSLNYAIAYGYSSLCSDTVHQNDYLGKALRYCLDNLRILADSARYSTYHLADTYQLIGFMLWGRNIRNTAWQQNMPLLEEICMLTDEAFGFVPEGCLCEDTDVCNVGAAALPFLRESTALFFLHDDPYQRLGALVSTGRCCLAKGDTAMAQSYFTEALLDSSLLGIAPKFEAMLYEGLLVAGCAADVDEVSQWTKREVELLNYIKQNEKADFMLQLDLSQMQHNNKVATMVAIVFSILSLALVVSIIMLRRRTKALQRETGQLIIAKQQDVERIANVETCLSVLRHDINPFISYLQNDKLPAELKHEVTAQLVRTFENIKNWTNLSIPSGLQFRCSLFALQDVFDCVAASVNNIRGEALRIEFSATEMTARGDSQLIEIMLRNLVNNAVQHTTSGSVTVSAVLFADDNRFIEVTVADTGEGMTAEQIEDLFRTDKKPKNETENKGYGSGFGLILCRYIIKKHDDNTIRGCRIWAESRVGEGSQFHFLIQNGGRET